MVRTLSQSSFSRDPLGERGLVVRRSRSPNGSRLNGRWPFACLALLLCVTPGRAQSSLPPSLRNVRFDQRLNEQVPLDLVFRDETGTPVKLADYFGQKPVILVLAYYRCPMLCTEVLNGLVRALLNVPFDVGKEFNVLTVSFDPRETPPLAAAKKKTYLERYGRPGAENGWHFLTGEEDSIKRLTQAVGFQYSYDAKNDQFSHASGIMVLTPAGKISRYFYDINYPPRDVRLGLVEASENKIGSPVDQVLLFCFHYDPMQGRYGPVIMNFVRLGGVLTVISLAIFMAILWRQERRKTQLEVAAASDLGKGGGV
jgi:protein SCO1/2